MRTTAALLPLVFVGLVPLVAVVACGGGNKTNGAVPTNASIAAASGSTPPPEPGAGGAGEQDHASVTTDTLGDAGDQSTKLAPVGSMVTDAGMMVPVGDAGSGRPIDELKAAVLAHRDQARACYDAQIKDHPGVQGDLIVHFVIDPAGKVIDAQLGPGSTISEPTIVNCVLDVIKKITFTANPTGRNSIVNYPFNFKPRS